jgi:beta-1,4-mannooligosaccharide/beta-1,4-mannosyl-N-acetylglucosamine phosphorylase
MSEMLPKLHSSPAITRWNNGAPVLSKGDIPYAAECIFNAGVTKYQGRYVMIFRNDFNYDSQRISFGGCNLGIAYSADGIKWEVEKNLS